MLIDGARQIGKTYIIRHVGQKCFENFIEINMVEDSLGDRLFANTKTLDDFYLQVSMLAGDRMKEKENTLIFLDEIQEYPGIATSLKWICIDGRYDVICSGSMLGINYKRIESNSVGYKSEFAMQSFDFEEFLWACGINDEIIDVLRNSYENITAVPELIHQQIMERFRQDRKSVV